MGSSLNTLITSDWQAATTNLERCKQAAANLIRVAKENDVKLAIFAGDLKHQYSPVPMDVILWWRDFIFELSQRNIKAICVNGNHDRVGLYSDERNWLPILKDAGAQVFWDPGYISLNQRAYFFLPFIGTQQRLDKWKRWIDQQHTDSSRDILIFHQTLRGSKLNKLGGTATDDMGVSIDDINPERFKYCIGGDIHLPQQVSENVWYVGSPFPIDWGEVNQQKVFFIVTEKGLKTVPTGMPGYYDPRLKGFKPPKDWSGARVRVFVPVDRVGTAYARLYKEAEAEAEKKYPGALVTVLPEVTEQETKSEFADGTEQEQIEAYVKSSLQDYDRVDEMIGYINHQLRTASQGLRADTGIQFTRAWAEGFLCYDKVEIDLTEPGVTLVQGENRDWPGRSNGVGKTSLLQMLPVALFGRTFKGQTADSWAKRDYKGTSRVCLEFKRADGSEVKVERTRNPVSVHLYVNGEDISSGGKTADVSKDIEIYSGYTFETFANVVYLDSEELDFLYGTPKQRHDVLARLRNLERFEKALKSVREEAKKMETKQMKDSADLQVVTAELNSKAEIQCQAKGEVERLSAEIQTTKGELFEEPQEPDHTPMDEAREAMRKVETRCNDYKTKLDIVDRRIQSLKAISDRCPTCGNKIEVDDHSAELAKCEKIWIVGKQTLSKSKLELDVLQDKFRTEATKHKAAQQAYVQQRQEWFQIISHLDYLEQSLTRWKGFSKDNTEEISKLEASVEVHRQVVIVDNEEIEFLRKAESILARDGLPAELTRLLCPRLNKTAQHFSELFADSEIQIQFNIEDGDIEPVVLNSHGGERLTDQSRGESRMAALITSFALREVSPKANVLILDEPGDGLDASNARAFAKGLKEMQARGVWLMTHNPNISAELMTERNVLLVKENGTTRIVS